jgi:hypothetical protein
LTFAPGVTTQTVTVVVNGDVLDEPDETFLVNLSNPTNATIADNQGRGTITDDDAPPTISINDDVVNEGDNGFVAALFTVTLSAASGQTVTASFATADASATAGSDYQATSGTLTFAPGTRTATITVVVIGDQIDETNEIFLINLSNPTNATLADNQGQCTIIDNDPVPSISINDVAVREGNVGTVNALFTVTLSAVSGREVSVAYATANGTATAGSDYAAATGRLVFASGTGAQTITVVVNGDVIDEPREKFFVNLRQPANATIADSQGVCTITDDEGAPVQFLAVLDGTQQAPPVKVKANGGGMFILSLTQDTLSFNIRAQGLSGPIISAHFANAAAGANGPVARTITSSFNGEVANGIWTSTDSESLTPELVAELLAGRIYVNLITTAFPNGEIRGQLLTGAPINLFAAFSGSQEVPAVTTVANGLGAFTLGADGKNLAFDITANGLSGPIIAAHFHLAAAGQNGPIIRDITGNFLVNKGSGVWSATDAGPLTPGRVAELLAGTIYVNIHTAANLDGEIRGQIGRQALPDWLVPVTVKAIASQNTTLPVTSSFDLAFGGHAAAKEGFDPSLDIPSAPPGFTYFAYFASNALPNFLTRDIRAWVPAFENGILWVLRIVNAAEITSEVRWDSTALPPQDSFTLSGAGLGEIDMRKRSSVRVTGNAILTLRKNLPTTCVTYDFTLANGGWYLISLPVTPSNNTVANLFPTATAAFGWDVTNQTHVPASALEPQRAYWILMPTAARVEICGIPVVNYSRSYMTQGWDLVGSVTKSSPLVDEPKGSVLTMFRWNPATQSYARVDSRQVEPKEGYWILVFGVPSKIVVGSSESSNVDTIKPGADLTAFYEKYGTAPPMPPSSVAVETSSLLPERYGLSQNYPNPFNPETVIEYQLPKPGRVNVKVYTILGAEVRTLIDEEKPAGYHRVRWDGRNEAGQRLNSGVYIYRIQAGDFVRIKKLVLVK